MTTKVKLTIELHLVDGDESKRFHDLGEVARYVKDRDMGEDYRRPWGLQTESGQMYFEGFTWSDLGTGTPWGMQIGSGPDAWRSSDFNYNPDLIGMPRKLRWKKRPLRESSLFSECHECYESSGQIAVVYRNFQDKWLPSLSGGMARYLEPMFNLDNAKLAIKLHFARQDREDADEIRKRLAALASPPDGYYE
jgi:hypothetical protein